LAVDRLVAATAFGAAVRLVAVADGTAAAFAVEARVARFVVVRVVVAVRAPDARAPDRLDPAAVAPCRARVAALAPAFAPARFVGAFARLGAFTRPGVGPFTGVTASAA
jgi:hypothetical protein